MPTPEELQIKRKELRLRIKALLENVQPEERQLNQIGTSKDALRKGNFREFIKLGELAALLKTNPNQLLNFPDDRDEKLKGILEAIGLSLGRNLEEATALAETAISALDNPAIRLSGLPPREAARSAAIVLLRQASGGSPRREPQ
jgi:hypothetical protein